MVIYTHSGTWFDVLNPQPEMINIIDIAHALSMICRFGGHTKKFYSVAEHCEVMSWYSDWQLTALLHDASEAYLIDIPKPIKRELPEYQALEHNLMTAIAKKFKIPYPFPPSVKVLDRRMLVTEREQVFNLRPGERWKPFEETLWPLYHTIEFRSPTEAKNKFLERFMYLDNLR